MKRTTIIAILLACAAVWLAPSPAVAGYKAGGGFFEVKVDGARKIAPIRVVWVWEPYFDDPVFLDVFASCVRKDDVGNETGKNKITFKNLTISSLETTKRAIFDTMRAKMRDGAAASSWGAAFMKPLHADGPALASIEVHFKGKLAAGDRFRCEIDVNEGVFGFTSAPDPVAVDPRVDGPRGDVYHPASPAGSGRLLEE